jgi:hypothetical protein
VRKNQFHSGVSEAAYGIIIRDLHHPFLGMDPLVQGQQALLRGLVAQNLLAANSTTKTDVDAIGISLLGAIAKINLWI